MSCWVLVVVCALIDTPLSPRMSSMNCRSVGSPLSAAYVVGCRSKSMPSQEDDRLRTFQSTTTPVSETTLFGLTGLGALLIEAGSPLYSVDISGWIIAA